MNRQTLDIAHIRALNRIQKIKQKHAEKFKKVDIQGKSNGQRTA